MKPEKYRTLSKLQLTGEVIPVTIQLSSTEMKFDFEDEPDNYEKTMTETAILSNGGNAPAKYTWHVLPGSAFTIQPKEGVIKPGGVSQGVITYVPPANTQNAESYLTLKTEDGYDQGTAVEGTGCGIRERGGG